MLAADLVTANTNSAELSRRVSVQALRAHFSFLATILTSYFTYYEILPNLPTSAGKDTCVQQARAVFPLPGLPLLSNQSLECGFVTN